MHSHDDELLVLAEALGEVKTKTEKLEAEFSTQARPLEAATNALSATLSGIKALQFHVIDNNLGALSARVEEMRKAVDEQVGVIALELKKADESNAAKAGQEADALRSEIAGLQAQLGTLGAQFEAQLARVEFAAKEEAKKLQLIPGPAGEAGASLNPRGTFIDGQTYNRLDVVSWLGSSYIATVDGVTEKPSKTSTQWQVLASRGNGGGGTASLNDMLGAPSAGTIVGSEGSSYVRKTLVAGANIAISETPSTITITGTEGEISLEDGSAAAPSLFFTNDPDTGIYRPGSNQVGISLGGSAQAVLTSTTFTVTPNLVVSGTGTSSIGGNATVAGAINVGSKIAFAAQAAGTTLVDLQSTDDAVILGLGGVTKIAFGGNLALTASNVGRAFAGATEILRWGSGVVNVYPTTASTSTSTGALVVSGGVGVAGALYVGSKGQFQSNDDALSLKYSTDGGSCLLAWKNTSGTTLWSIGGGIDTRQDELVFRRGSTTVLNLNNSNNATFAGTLTVSGAAGITGSDLTLGASGPSVKSTLSARAPRQGLVFDGTAGATVASVPAFGTGDFTVVAFGSTPSLTNTQCIVGASAINGFFMRLDPTTGTLRAGKAGVSDNTSTFSATAGKAFVVAYTRSGATGTFYANGIAAGTASNESASRDYTQAINLIGEFAGGQIFGGYLSVLIYNRALSAAEVVALYESGAPAAVDYPATAAGTTINSSAWVNNNYSTFSSANGATLSATYSGSGTQYAYAAPTFVSKYGNVIRFYYDLTLTSGQVPYVVLTQIGVKSCSATANLTAGSGNYVDLVVNDPSSATTIAINNTAASSWSIANARLTPLGLLLAPDAAQAGGGSVWYDTSGNAANITLPASGVSWNVPTSGKINNAFAITNSTASTSTSTGALVVSGGVGVGGAINVGGKVVVNGGDASSAQFAVASASGTLVANLTAGSTTNQSFGLRMFAGTSASDYGLFLRNVTDTTTLFKVDGVGGTTVGGSVTTAAPAGGTAAAWKLGTVASVSPTSPNRTIEVDIGGTIYYIHAKTTNN